MWAPILSALEVESVPRNAWRKFVIFTSISTWMARTGSPRLKMSDAVPVPTVILSTSPDKYQALWRVEGFDFDQQETTLKSLLSSLGETPRAPTGTGFSASQDSTIASTILLTQSPPNISARSAIVQRTSGWTIQVFNRHSRSTNPNESHPSGKNKPF